MKKSRRPDIVAKQSIRKSKQSGDEYVLLDITHRDRDFPDHRFSPIFK